MCGALEKPVSSTEKRRGGDLWGLSALRLMPPVPSPRARCRPSEIDFAPDGVRAQVVRRTYLGDIVDYLLKIGNVELRVQKPRRHSTAQLGETCHLRFNRLLWYDRKEETASKT